MVELITPWLHGKEATVHSVFPPAHQWQLPNHLQNSLSSSCPPIALTYWDFIQQIWKAAQPNPHVDMLKAILDQQLRMTFKMFFYFTLFKLTLCRVFINTEYFSPQMLIHLKSPLFLRLANLHLIDTEIPLVSLSFIIPSGCTYRSVNFLYRQELSFTLVSF